MTSRFAVFDTLANAARPGRLRFLKIDKISSVGRSNIFLAMVTVVSCIVYSSSEQQIQTALTDLASVVGYGISR